MLRSRPNRQQRPSESSDERQGGGGYHYGGYPPTSSADQIRSISSGADDDDYDDDYNKKKNGKMGSRLGRRFGGGGGGGFGSTSSSPSSPKSKFGSGSSPSFPRQSAAYSSSKGSSGGGSGGGALLLFLAITILFLLSGTTFYYRKMTIRATAQLQTLHIQARHPHENSSNNNNNNNSAHASAIAALKSKQNQLQGEFSKTTAENQSMENEMTTTMKIITVTKEELTAYKLQYSNMVKSLSDLENKVKETRQKWFDSHITNTAGDNNNNNAEGGGEGGIIIPGGPGHTLNQRRELERMNSREDYEDYLSRRDAALWDKIDLLIEKIGRESKREALEWFGAELLRQNVPEDEIAFRVELEVEYPKYSPDNDQYDNPESWTRSRGILTIEMAPLQLMPIAVNLFLQQIHHKLWNGCGFVINAMHILQAGPHKYRGSGKYLANAAELKQKFEQSKLDKMPYQEYSTEYPHVRYTVGFAGRPGGPDFYINKVDNSINHGPGGQSHHDLHEEADPCFGKVVGGIELMDEINRIPVDREKGSLLAAPVKFVSGRVIAFRKGKGSGGGVTNKSSDDVGGGGMRMGGGGGGPPSEGGRSFDMPSS